MENNKRKGVIMAKETKKETYSKSNNGLDTRLSLLEKDLEHLFNNVIEMQKDLQRVLDRMGL